MPMTSRLSVTATRRWLATLTLALLLSVLCLASGWALSAPPRVVNGDVRISQGDNVWNIEIRSRQAIIEWSELTVAAGETVNFILPDAQASVLNRIGTKGARIQGALNANGSVLLVSRGGVVIEPTATLQASHWVASWHSLSNTAYLSQRWTFMHPLDAASGGVQNRGVVQAFGSGSVYLIGDIIDNTGIVFSPAGRVQAACGRTIYGLSDQPDMADALPFAVEPHPLEGADNVVRVSNAGVINAPYVALDAITRSDELPEAPGHEPMLVDIPFQGDRITAQPSPAQADNLTMPLIELP